MKSVICKSGEIRDYDDTLVPGDLVTMVQRKGIFRLVEITDRIEQPQPPFFKLVKMLDQDGTRSKRLHNEVHDSVDCRRVDLAEFKAELEEDFKIRMGMISQLQEEQLMLTASPKYFEDRNRFVACKHTRIQSYTEFCLDCGFNTWAGPKPKDYQTS